MPTIYRVSIIICLYHINIRRQYASVDRRMLARCFCCCFFTLLLSSFVCEAITRQEFFDFYNYGNPFNATNGSLPKELDGISYVNLTLYDVLFPFFGEKYGGLQVSVRVRRSILTNVNCLGYHMAPFACV